MSSNEGKKPENYEISPTMDQNRPSRNKSGPRRSRGRYGYDQRNGHFRYNRDRRQDQSQSGPNANGVTVRNVPAVIDLSDSSQFPSITGSSSRRSRPNNKSRQNPQSTPVVTSAQSQQPSSSVHEQRAVQNVSVADSAPVGYQYPRSQSGYRGGRGSRYGGSYRGNYNHPSRRQYRYPPPVAYGENVAFSADPMSHNLPNQEYTRDRTGIDCVRQVEYYFCETNLVSDQYLRSNMDSNGYVSLRLIHDFKRVRLLKLDFEEFVNRVKESNQLEVNDEDKTVRVRRDHQKWLAYNRYISENNLEGSQPHEFPRFYVQFMQSTYGPHVHIPYHIFSQSQPRPKIFPAQYVPPQYFPVSYVEGAPVYAPVPYYTYPTADNTMAYPQNVGYPVHYASYMEYPYDYSYYDPSYYYNDSAPVIPSRIDVNTTSSAAAPDQDPDSLAPLMGELSVENRPQDEEKPQDSK